MLFTLSFYRHDVNPLLRLAIPLILTGLIESISPFFSTVFLANLGQQELVAGAFVRGLFFTLMVVLWGVLTSVSVLVSQKHGEKNDMAVAHIVRDGALLALMLTPPTILLLWYIAPIFLLFGQEESIVTLAQSYLHSLAWGVFPDFMMLVLLQFLTGLGHTRVTMIFMMCWTPFSILITYPLIFGKFGLPAFGISGIGWGITISYWIFFILLVIYLMRHFTYKKYMQTALSSLDSHYLKELLQIGVPLGAMYCLEVGFFFVLTLVMGLVGEVQLAATQITMQYLGLFSTVVFAISQAVTVRMGHQLGEKNVRGANATNYAGVFIAVSFTVIVALFYIFLPELLIGADLNVSANENTQIVKYTKEFFILCGLFQVFEAARISLMGSLRALKDTRFTLLASLIGFWLVPLPIGYLLTCAGIGGAGLWVGMAAGAACSALLLNQRYCQKLRHYSL